MCRVEQLDFDRHGGDIEVSWKNTSVLLVDVAMRDVDEVALMF